MSITYNPNSDNIFDVTNEKTDHRTDFKTDYDTDPGRVTKRETYRHCWRNYWGNTVCDTRSRTVVDREKIKRHDEMNNGKAYDVIKEQLISGLDSIKSLNNIIIAYEPVWAIGTGLTASVEQFDSTLKCSGFFVSA